MSDFETHPVGTRFILDDYAKEIQLSRALARAIEQELHQYGKVIPHSVLQAYNKLTEYYNKQIEEGVQ
jgi:predicted naringenin-chalcone synthase